MRSYLLKILAIKFLVLIILSSCSNYDYKLSQLNKQTLTWDELPVKVREFYKDASNYGNKNPSLVRFAYLNNDNKYQFKRVKSKVGPWLSHYILINSNDGLIHKIELGAPIPYLVYNDQLYLVNKFNLFTNLEDITKIEVTKYNLKVK